MRTDYLRYFIDVARLGSISAAAKKNFMTPQGISRSIAALESELGCKLLQRDSNKVNLTRFGEQLLESAQQMIEAENNMRRNILELQTEKLVKSKLQFTCYNSPIFFDSPLFWPATGIATAHYGKVQFLQRTTPKVLEALLEAAGITRPDIVFAGGLALFSVFPEENDRTVQNLIDVGYEYYPFMHTCDYVLVPAYSTLANADALSKAEIREHRLAVNASGGMERAISRHIGSESIYVSSGDSAHRSYLCRMGEALTFVPGVSLVYGVPEGTVAIPMADPYTIEIGFVARANILKEGVLADIIDRLRDFYSKHEDSYDYELLEGSLERSFVRVTKS